MKNRFEFGLCYLLFVKPLTSYLTSLSFTYEMKMTVHVQSLKCFLSLSIFVNDVYKAQSIMPSKYQMLINQ